MLNAKTSNRPFLKKKKISNKGNMVYTLAYSKVISFLYYQHNHLYSTAYLGILWPQRPFPSLPYYYYYITKYLEI